MYKKIYIQRTRVIFLYEYGYNARRSSERRINKLKQKSWEREGKPGDEFCAIQRASDPPCRKKKKEEETTRNAALAVEPLICFYLARSFKTRVEGDIYPSHRLGYLTKTLYVHSSRRLLGWFAKRAAL